MTATFAARIGRIPVILSQSDLIGNWGVGRRRCIYTVHNTAGRQLGVLVERTGPTTGRYVDPSAEVQSIHLDGASNWFVALNHEPVRVGIPTRLPIDTEADGLRFPPEPIVLDDGRSPGWDAPGSEVAYLYGKTAYFGTVAGLRHELSTDGELWVDSGIRQVPFHHLSGSWRLDGRGPELLPANHPMILRLSGRIPEPPLPGGDWGWETDLDAHFESM